MTVIPNKKEMLGRSQSFDLLNEFRLLVKCYRESLNFTTTPLSVFEVKQEMLGRTNNTIGMYDTLDSFAGTFKPSWFAFYWCFQEISLTMQIVTDFLQVGLTSKLHPLNNNDKPLFGA